jgi:hypothetical protein
VCGWQGGFEIGGRRIRRSGDEEAALTAWRGISK